MNIHSQKGHIFMQSDLRIRLKYQLSFFRISIILCLRTHTRTLACLAFRFVSTSNCFLCQQYIFLYKVNQKQTSHCGIFAPAILLS